MPIIYKATNLINSKVYIGKCVYTLNKRMNNHKLSALNESPSHFHNAIRKYGFENFKWDIVYENNCTLEELGLQEKFFIRKYQSNKRKNGYNMTIGGEGGDILSNHPKREEICKKLSIASTGRRKSQEEIQKIISNQPYLGKKLDANYCNKISEGTKKAMMRPDVRLRYLEGLKKREENRRIKNGTKHS